MTDYNYKKLSDEKLADLAGYYKECMDGEPDTTLKAIFEDRLIKIRKEQDRRKKKKLHGNAADSKMFCKLS